MTNEQKTVPSFGFSSLKEEIESLTKKVDISSKQLAQQHPIYAFGRLKKDIATDKLVEELETAQKKINTHNHSKNFLKDTLRLIYPHEKIVIPPKRSKFLEFTSKEIEQLPFLVAANIWQVLEGEEPVYTEFFFKGIQEIDISSSPNQDLINRLHFNIYQ